MLPVARVVYPDEYVIQRDQSQWNGTMDWDGTDQWPAIARLSERGGPFPLGYEGLTDKELAHCFDREMGAGKNPHLIRPGSATFRPWSEYRVVVPDSHGNEIKRPTAEHFYCYWQVHQLYWIQQYPDLYENSWMIDRIPQEDSGKKFLPRAPKTEHLADFMGLQSYFDALSFWVTVYGRERGRTFAGITETDGVRKLDDAQAAAHGKKIAILAGKVTKRFQPTSEGLYSFLRKLIELIEDHERKERFKLADALKRDIFRWEDLLRLTTGETRDEVADEMGKVSIHDRRTFRHLDIATKERDYALNLLNRVSTDCNNALADLGDSQWLFSEADANELLNYCEQAGLGLFMTALSGTVAIGEEEYQRNYRRVQMYTNLKNVLNSYEYLLKTVAQQAGVVVGTETLTQLVGQIMAKKTWYQCFKARQQQGLLKGSNTQEFLTNLGTLLADNQLKGSPQGYWAQKFLVMCLARNMTVHSCPSEDSYYGDLFGPMLDAAIIATFYTWKFSKGRGWV